MKLLALTAAGLLLAASAPAVERTWTGMGGNNLWSNPNNWSPAGAPQDGDDLNFFDICLLFIGCPAVTTVNDLSNLRTGAIRFGDTSGNVE